MLANTYRNLSGESADRLDSTVRRSLNDAGVTSVARALVFKPISIASTVVSLAALDQVESRVRLTSGRLPSVCTPARCEVVSVRLPGVATTFEGAVRAERELGIVVTGTAELTDQRLVGVGLIGANRPLLLGGAPERIADLESLQLFGRTLGWFGTLDGRAIATAGVDRVQPHAQRTLRRGRPGGGRAAVGRLAGRGRRRRRGPRRSLGGPVLRARCRRRRAAAGTVPGRRRLAAPSAAAGRCAARPARRELGADHRHDVVAGGPVGAPRRTGRHRRRRAGGRATSDGLRHVRPGRRRRPPPWCPRCRCWSRWRCSPSSASPRLRDGRTPARAPPGTSRCSRWWPRRWSRSWCSAATSEDRRPDRRPGRPPARRRRVRCRPWRSSRRWWPSGCWPPWSGLIWSRSAAARAASRSTAASSTRIIARRRPLLPMVTAGFLAASCCLLVFTAGYRESLRQSGEDQAAFRVPLDVSVAASARIATPLEALDGNRLREVAPGTVVRPVVTSAVTAFGGTPRALVLPLTGVDPEALTEMHEFRATTGASVTADTLAQRLIADRPPDPAAPVIPAGARRITLRARGLRRRHHAGAVAQHRRRAAAAGALRRLGSGADRRAARWRGTHRARSGDRGVGDPDQPA